MVPLDHDQIMLSNLPGIPSEPGSNVSFEVDHTMLNKFNQHELFANYVKEQSQIQNIYHQLTEQLLED